jgi:hypothetical protein
MLSGLFLAGMGITFGSLAGMVKVSRHLPGSVIVRALRGAEVGVKRGDKMRHVQVRKTEWTKYGARINLKLPNGLSSDDIKKHETLLSEALGKEIEVKYHPRRGVYIDVYDSPIPKEILYEPEKRSDLKVPIGVNRRGDVIYYDFEGQFPHLLIGGCSGGGKSVLLRLILTHLSFGPKPDLYLADLKSGIELGLFQDLAHTKRFATSLPELRLMLEAVTKEMRRRYEVMKGHGLREWDDNHLVVVLDELVHLYESPKEPTESKKMKAAIKSMLAELSAQARAAGISLVLCTQRPDAKTVDGIIKTNMATAISFKTVNETQSEIILDSPQSARLPQIPGRAIFRQSDYTTIQCFNLPYEMAEELLEGVERRADTADSPNFEVEGDTFFTGDDGLFDSGPDSPNTPPWW